MKKVLYLASSVALLASMVFAGNVLAARSSSAAHKSLTVTLCSSTPIGALSLEPDSKGIENGVVLAIHWKSAALKKAGLKVNYLPLDDGDPSTDSYSTTKEENNATQCATTHNALGYVGTLNSGAAQVGVPVTNKAHLVQISPANTNPGLTAPGNVNGFGGRKTVEPCSYPGPSSCSNKISEVTYYRTVTTDAIQGPAGAVFARDAFHPKSYWLVDDELSYGVGLAANFAGEAKKLKMKQLGHSHIDSSGGTGTEATSSTQIANAILSASRKPDMVYCGCDEETAGALARDLRQGGYNKPWLGGDAFVTSTWFSPTAGAGPVGSKGTYATNVGPLPAKTGKVFLRLYHKYFPGFERKPGIQAYDAPAFDAAGIILTAMIEAKDHGKLKGSQIAMRDAVVKYVSKIKFTGALGTTTFNKNGDTSNHIISIYKANSTKGVWGFLKQFHAPGNPEA